LGADGLLLRTLLVNSLFAALLFGCASETHSNVSQGDIAPNKYKKLALFVENLDAGEKSSAEQIITGALGEEGLNVVSSTQIFGGRSLTPEAQAALIRSQGIDAALYVTVLEKGAAEEQIEGAWYDFNNDEMHIDPISGITATLRGYEVRPDGTVYYRSLGLKTRAELQDVNTAKEVWQSETVVVGHGQVSNMAAMLAQAAKQIAEKMRSDQAI
jgi:hypothetical protein